MTFKTIAALTLTAALAGCAANTAQTPVSETTKTAQTTMTHTVESRYTFDETLARLQNAVKEKSMSVFAVIDHQAAARENGLEMQPASVIVFGTPKAGTPLMVKDPAFALQLPLRVLVTEVDGKVLAVFNDTRALIAGSRIEYAEVENTLANAEKLIRAVVTQ